MKTEKILVFFILVLFTTAAVSQSRIVSAYADIGYSTGILAKANTNLYGFGGAFEGPIVEQFGLEFSIGYNWLSKRSGIDSADNDFELPKTYLIPLQVKCKYYLSDEQEGFYTAVDAGMHFCNVNVIEYDLSGNDRTVQDKFSTFSYALSMGYMSKDFEFSIRYQFLNSTPMLNYWAIRGAFRLFTSQ